MNLLKLIIHFVFILILQIFRPFTHTYWFFLFHQGTVSPTHYVVIHDESEMSVDTIQKLSYKMTHLYYNWNGTVRVPAPCQVRILLKLSP